MTPETFKIPFCHLVFTKSSSHFTLYLGVYWSSSILAVSHFISLEVKYFFELPFLLLIQNTWNVVLACPVVWRFLCVCVCSHCLIVYADSWNGNSGPLRSLTIIPSLNPVIWHQSLTSSCLNSSFLSFLQMLQSCKMLQSWKLLDLTRNFLLTCWRPAFPFLRFFVSQLEPTRNLTPTCNGLIQIQCFSNFPEVWYSDKISCTYFSSIGSLGRKY